MENEFALKVLDHWLHRQTEIPEPKPGATYRIGWYIGSDKWHEKSAYCLMELHNEEITIIGCGESRLSLKDKVEEISKKYNAKILKQDQ